MNRLVRLFSTSVGRKLVTAATGLLLLAFLFGHLFGNLKVFQGREAINSYADWLQGHPLLWVFRIGLLTVFVLHAYGTLSLARENRAARPRAYRRYQPLSATIASRSMVISGLAVLAFILYHLLHFTFGVVDAENTRLLDAQQRLDVYTSLVSSFQNPWISGTYIVAMVLIGLHLWHGIASTFQTFGLRHESYQTLIRIGSIVLVTLLVVGNCSIPIMILAGRVTLGGAD
jgi:succinate dehydrogenase / fumarate reductase cytochrome b subunit